MSGESGTTIGVCVCDCFVFVVVVGELYIGLLGLAVRIANFELD